MKNRKTAAYLSIFLGVFGIHKFYLGQYIFGLIFLIITFLGAYLVGFPLGMCITFLLGIFQGLFWLSQSDETFNENHKSTKKNLTQETIETSSSLISESLTKTKKYIQKKISKSYLTGCNWRLFEYESNDNIQYIFRDNNELLISENGIIKRSKYELIIDNNSILISSDNITELYNIVVVETDFLFLNKVSSNEILKFFNHTKLKDELKGDIRKIIENINY